MDTLTTYVNNTFSAVPQTPDIQKLKSEILDRMVTRYNELQNEGKNDNEITGIIISEFSNISDIINEQLKNHNASNPVSDNYTPSPETTDKKTNRLVNAVLSVFWPLVIAFYLYISFIFGSWETSWLILIIAVVLKNFFCNYFGIEDRRH
ncbi:MAG: hypothetical protein Q4F66_11145 [Clostridium sp.]|nr:hypothetical protein [Clostridium sp.]